MLLEIVLVNFLLFFLGLILAYILNNSENITLIIMILNICSDNLIFTYYFWKLPLCIKKILYLRVVLFLISLLVAYLNRLEVLLVYPLSIIFFIILIILKINEKIKIFVYMSIYQIIYIYI